MGARGTCRCSTCGSAVAIAAIGTSTRRSRRKSVGWGRLDEADKIYNGVYDELNKIAGTKEEKERRVAEFLPKRSTLQLRLAAVAVEKRHYVEAFQNLKAVDKATDLSEAEQIEKVQNADL